jgi:replicative superfamily II helicase
MGSTYLLTQCNKEKGLYVEYERSMVLQMCGRAGRPPFDDTGTIIIMTRRETVKDLYFPLLLTLRYFDTIIGQNWLYRSFVLTCYIL